MKQIAILDAADIDALLSPDDLIAMATRAFIAISDGTARQPPRALMKLHNGGFGLMPGELTEPPVFGIKLVSLFPDAPAQGLSSHQGLVILFDGKTGAPRLIVNGGRLTALRTAAASVVSAKLLARPEGRKLGLIGCGEQAAAHLMLFRAILPPERVIVWARRRDAAEEFARVYAPVEIAGTVEGLCSEADVICALTKASEPVLLGEWLRPGQHVVAAGSSAADKHEIDADVIGRASVYLDWRDGADREAGDIQAAIAAKRCDASVVRGEIGELLLGRIAGRRTNDEITLFKSLGVAAEDLMLGQLLLDRWSKQQEPTRSVALPESEL